MECTTLPLFNYEVELPIDSSSPPSILFQLIFSCDGVTYTSPLFSDSIDALEWVTETLSEYGTWSFDGSPSNIILLTDSYCGSATLFTESTPSETQHEDQMGAIALSTTNAASANKYLWCFSLLDCNYTGTTQSNYANRNVLDATFKSIIASLNPTALQYAGGGGRVNASQVVIGKTDWTIAGGLDCTDCSRAEGLCCPVTPFSQDWFLVNVELCRQLGIGLDIAVNVQLPDVTWQAQAAWIITHMANQGVALKHIMFGLENVTGDYDVYWIGHAATNSADFILKADNYINKVNPEMLVLQAANPTKLFYLDTADIEDTGNRFSKWNQELDGHTNNGRRNYFNLNNLLQGTGLTLSNTDWNYNLTVINTLVFTTAVNRLNIIHTAHPTQKIAVYQWGLRNPEVTPNLENTILGMLFQAKMTKMMLDYNYQHGEIISYASYQSLKQFITNSNTILAFGQSLILIGKMFTGATIQYIPITFNFGNAVKGVAIFNGTTYRVLIINDGIAQGTSADGITINGILKTNWTRESYFGNSLDTTTINHTTTTEHSVYIPAYSISVLTIN